MASELRFAVRLIDGLSGPAKSGAASISQLTSKLQASKTELASYEAKLGSLSGVAKLASQLKAAKSELSSYHSQLSRARSLGDIEGYRKYTKLVDEARRGVFELTKQAEAAGALGSRPLSEMRKYSALIDKTKQNVSSLTKETEEASAIGSRTFGALAAEAGPYVAAIGAVVAVGAAFVGGLAAMTYGLVKFADEATEARRQASAFFDAMGDGAANAGTRTLDMLDELSTRLPQTRGELVVWARELEAAGVTDLSDLRGQIAATAAAQAMLGKEGADRYLTLVARIREAAEGTNKLKLADRMLARSIGPNLLNATAKQLNVSTKQLIANLKSGTQNATDFGNALEFAMISKGKGPLSELDTELSTVLKKGASLFSQLFEGIDFLPLSSALHYLFGEFDKGGEHGKRMQSGIKGALNEIVADLTWFVNRFHEAFLRTEIFILRHQTLLEGIGTALKVVGAIIVGTVAVAMASLLAPVAAGLALWTATVAVIERIPKILDWVGDKISTLGTKLGQWAGGAIGSLVGLGSGSGPGGVGGGLPTHTAPAHASGGLVMRPAAGEFLASVAPGEYIVPKGGYRAENDNSGVSGSGRPGEGTVISLHVDRIEIQAPSGVTNATEISANALARVLERYQLAVGR